jgi:hypothetical protein
MLSNVVDEIGLSELFGVLFEVVDQRVLVQFKMFVHGGVFMFEG